MRFLKIFAIYIMFLGLCLVDASLIYAQVQFKCISPLPNQVFQRERKDGGKIYIKGLIDSEQDIDKLKIQITGEQISAVNLVINSPKDKLEYDYLMPSGGPYKIKFNFIVDEGSIYEFVVNNFYVGEVFVVAGQSNASNFGAEKLTTQSKMVFKYDGTSWQLGNDPFLSSADMQKTDHGTGGSCWTVFGDKLYKKLKVPVGISSVAYGGTSVLFWSPWFRYVLMPVIVIPVNYVLSTIFGGMDISVWNLFEKLTDRVLQFPPNGFRAILWHQGEADTIFGTPTFIYFRTMVNIIDSLDDKLKNKFSKKVPWFVAEASHVSSRYFWNKDDLKGQKKNMQAINLAQRTLWEEGIALAGPKTDDLQDGYRRSDGTHFERAGQIEHGKRWAQKVGDWLLKMMVVSASKLDEETLNKVQWLDQIFNNKEYMKCKKCKSETHSCVAPFWSQWFAVKCTCYDKDKKEQESWVTVKSDCWMGDKKCLNIVVTEEGKLECKR